MEVRLDYGIHQLKLQFLGGSKMRIKPFFAKVFILILVTMFPIGVNAAADIHETFDDSSLSEWIVEKNSGTIQVTSSNTLQIISPDGYGKYALVQHRRLLNGNADFEIDADMKFDSNEGESALLLRDNQREYDGHIMNIASLNSEKVYLLPDIFGESISEEIQQGSFCRISMVVHTQSDSAEIYVNGKKKLSVENFSQQKDGKFKDFNWSGFYCRISVSGGNTPGKLICDNVYVGTVLQEFLNVSPKIYETFDDSSMYGWIVEKNSGTINVLDDKALQIISPSGKSSYSLIQNYKLLEASDNFEINADMKFASSEGEGALLLRDNQKEYNGHIIKIASLNSGKVYLMPDLFGDSISEDIPQGSVCRISAVVRMQYDNIEIYVNGKKKLSVENFSQQKDGKFKDFNWNGFYFRISASSGNVPAKLICDNVYAGPETSNDEKIKLMTSGFIGTNGRIGIKFIAEEKEGTEKTVTAIIYHYHEGLLKEVRLLRDIQLAAYAAVSGELYFDEAVHESGDLYKFMMYNSIDNMVPYANAEATQLSEEYYFPTVPGSMELTAKSLNARPRILGKAEDFANVKTNIKSEPNAYQALWYEHIKNNAATYLTAELPTNKKDTAGRLTASADVLERVKTMAFVYYVDGESKYKDKIWEYMELCSKWSDWGDSHFLNTADILNAFAIAYDWLYNDWTQEQRAVMANAMLTKGLYKADELYDRNIGWAAYTGGNWLSVCDTGVILAASALIGDYPRCEDILSKALSNIQKYYNNFEPDGGGPEGVYYWDYGMKYLSWMLSTIEGTFYTDFGHLKSTSLRETIEYPLYMSGKELVFNYSDSANAYVDNSCMFFFGNEYGDKSLNGFRLYQLTSLKREADITDILWYDKYKTSKNYMQSNSKLYRNIQSVVMRNGFADNTDGVVMLHCGSNNLGHDHLDVGTFFYETNGIRWIRDLGAESYYVYGLSNDSITGKNKWCYYRNRAEGHNTWVINPNSNLDQERYGEGKITDFSTDGTVTKTESDLTGAYSEEAQTVKRDMRFDTSDNSLIIRDKLVLNNDSEAYWFAHTASDIVVSDDKKSAILTDTYNYKTYKMWVGITEGDGTFEVMDAKPLSTSPNPDAWEENINLGLKQSENAGNKKLTIHYSNVSEVNQTVVMIPIENNESSPAHIPVWN